MANNRNQDRFGFNEGSRDRWDRTRDEGFDMDRYRRFDERRLSNRDRERDGDWDMSDRSDRSFPDRSREDDYSFGDRDFRHSENPYGLEGRNEGFGWESQRGLGENYNHISNRDFNRRDQDRSEMDRDWRQRDMGYGNINERRSFSDRMSERGNDYIYQNQTSHFGKGPKGWKRSDEKILDAVCDCLERDHRVDASQIDVKVTEGVVTLSGSVEDRQTKRRAEDIIENLPGVRDIKNELSVNQSFFQQAKEVLTGQTGNKEDKTGRASASKH